MAGISQLMVVVRVPVTIKIRPWWYDHVFGGRAVLPAVEILLILAAEVTNRFPDVDVRTMQVARFSRFLEIPAGIKELQVFIEFESLEDGAVRAVLLTRKSFRKMTRLLEHARVLFSGQSTVRGADVPTTLASNFIAKKTLAARQVYSKYVPFGPACHSIQGAVKMNDKEILAIVQASAIPHNCPAEELLGSPFPLDGAMHAACVLGQQLVDFIPLPLGFADRIVHQPTRSGDVYTARAVFLSREDDRLFFDLRIEDEQRVYEEVSGLRMQKIL